jgi:2-keto-4-pentenoate hydratase
LQILAPAMNVGPMNYHGAAAWLLDARLNGSTAAFPDAIRPKTEADAYAIQALITEQLGPVGGWKVGAPGPHAPPNCAPMPAAGIFPSPAKLDPAVFTLREVESEIAFRLATDLPPRGHPYTESDMVAAIASCHPAIEILQPRFAEPETIDALSHQADLIRHGAFVYGDVVPAWQHIDFPNLKITQTIAGGPTTEAVGNPAGDMMRLMLWLANSGAVWAGGLRAGQFITCGSWTGRTPAPAGALVTTAFHGLPQVTLSF